MNDGTTLYNGGIFRLFCRVFSSKLFGVVIILFDAPRPPMMFLIVIRYHPPLHHTPLTGGPWWRVDCFIAGFHRLAARLQNSEQCDLWLELFNIEVKRSKRTLWRAICHVLSLHASYHHFLYCWLWFCLPNIHNQIPCLPRVLRLPRNIGNFSENLSNYNKFIGTNGLKAHFIAVLLLTKKCVVSTN